MKSKRLTSSFRNHSLTYVMTALGVVSIGASYPLQSGWWCDLFMGLGCGMLGVALLYWLSRHLRETVKPED